MLFSLIFNYPNKIIPIAKKFFTLNSYLSLTIILGLLLSSCGLGFSITSTTNQSGSKYGAIAYSKKSKFYGHSWQYCTRKGAEAKALRECRKRTEENDCTVVVWFENVCGALAVAPGGAYSARGGTPIATAERKALQSCSKQGEKCKILTSVCAHR